MTAVRRRLLAPDALLFCLLVFAAARLAAFALGLVAVALLPNPATIPRPDDLGIPGPVDVPGWPASPIEPGWHNLFTSFERFDALWFLRIVEDGYRTGDQSAVFFPLYPLAVRAVSFAIGGHPLAASLLVSNAAFLAALCALFALTEREHGEDVARRAVVYTAAFPTAFFFLAPYSESLFLFLAVACFLAAREGRWGVAGAFGFLAALTRSVGIVLAGALVVEAFLQWREGRSRSGTAFAWATGPALGVLAYLAWWQVRAGDWMAPFSGQARWQREWAWPWTTLWRATTEAFRWIGQYPGGYHLLDWLLVVPILVLATYGVLRIRASYSVYVWGSLLVPLVMAFEPRPLMSVPRFVVTMFPSFWVMAIVTHERRVPHAAVVGASAAGLALLTALFINWYYIF